VLLPATATAAPGDVTNFQANPVLGGIRLTWNGDSTGIGVWNVQRSVQSLAPGSPASPFTILVQTGAGAIPGVFPFQYTDGSLQHGNRYCYRIEPQQVSGARLPPSVAVCIDLPVPPALPALLQVIQPTANQSLCSQRLIQIRWAAVSGAAFYTIVYTRPTSVIIVPGAPFTGTTASFDPTRFSNILGPGTFTVNALDALNQRIATGSVAVNLTNSPAVCGGGGGGGGCSTATQLSYHGNTGRQFGFFSGSKTFTVNLTGGWFNRGIRFEVTPGNGQFTFFCTSRPTVRMTGLSAMGYSSNIEVGVPQPSGSVKVETDNIGPGSFFSQSSGTIALEVTWPQSSWGTCNSPPPCCSCFEIVMTPLP
jgi:hypothetical protein